MDVHRTTSRFLRPPGLALFGLAGLALGCGAAEPVGETETYADPAPAMETAPPHPNGAWTRMAVDRPMTEGGALAVLADGRRVPVADAIVVQREGLPEELLLFDREVSCALIRETPFERADVLVRMALPQGALGDPVEAGRVRVATPIEDERVKLEGPVVAKVCEADAPSP